MESDSARWHPVTDSEHRHEEEGLALIQKRLPDRPPFHAWTNFEFTDGRNHWAEVDLLVLAPAGLFLVELKHYRGAISGNAYQWKRGSRSEPSPLITTRRKAQRLKSVLLDAARDLKLPPHVVPWIDAAVLLHAPDSKSHLDPGAEEGIWGIDGRENISNLPGISGLFKTAPKQSVDEKTVLALIEKAGFAKRREREIGSWRLVGPAEDVTEGIQDRPAEHRITQDAARIRFYLVPAGTAAKERGARRELAKREFLLTRDLRHDGILQPRDLVDDESGDGLVFDRVEDEQPLDLWLADNSADLSLAERLGLVRQIVEALHYAHGHGVVHRALSPSDVLVTTDDQRRTRLRIGGWRQAGTIDRSSTAAAATRAATRLFGSDDAAVTSLGSVGAFVAPEGRWSPEARRVPLDMFALGALSYLILTGVPPAGSATELAQRLAREEGLDLAAHLPEAPRSLRDLLREATAPQVSKRTPDAGRFIEGLSLVEAGLIGVAADHVDPLEAPPGTVFDDRFTLVRRLGSGSTAAGLLVTDAEADGVQRVLKVALDDSATTRIAREAQTLVALGAATASRRLVRILATEPLDIGGRQALLLESAGEETLADVLQAHSRRLSLDLLKRWGGDLLEALVALDAAGFDHRDIKPANLGVREQPSDHAKHLVLFDFSMTGASPDAVEAGTPPYVDPFLGVGSRRRWDSAAERYAVGVTLYEMATGKRPVYGDGESAPQFGGQITLDPADFDPAASDALVTFFTHALSGEISERHASAETMHRAWKDALAPATVPATEDADAVAARATLDTALSEAGLSARALSALEPFGVVTVGDATRLDLRRVNSTPHLVAATKTEIGTRIKQWRARLGEAVDDAALETPSDDVLLHPRDAAELLVASASTPDQARAAALILGLDGDLDAFAIGAALSTALGPSSPNAWKVLSGLFESWTAVPATGTLLKGLSARVEAALEDLAGVAWTDELATALSPDQGSKRLVAGLVRASLDTADHLCRERSESGEPRFVRRRRRDGRMLVSRDPKLADAALTLGTQADSAIGTDSGSPVMPQARAAATLREVAGPLASLDHARLNRVAARFSTSAGATADGSLFRLNIGASEALRLALRSAESSQAFDAQQLRQLVKVRFPGAKALPPRPKLDDVVAEADVGLTWDGKAYVVASAPATATVLTSSTTVTVPSGPTGLTHESELRTSGAERSFLALGVRPRHHDAVISQLLESFSAREVNVTDLLLDTLTGLAEDAGVSWDLVLNADSATAGSEDRRGLAVLVERAVPTLVEHIDQALLDADGRPVLLTDTAPLARYGHLDVIARYSEITRPRAAAVWLVFPEETGRGAALDGVPVPTSHPGQFVHLGGPTAAEGAHA
ncbi:BREX system serine/threonine kinase PglW [Demequina muriae]|uniref:BREX system serine/threonine kinase PglW n=1 Tax=Demequina muriae TaxID=3051664 RepID=A0ABT8GE60_9MICO|nr:BREX system serine/threonine kinase PglW [Demequina sp. EGI L300058]MDN4479710.1 BREX system serine/threonine kinase PglW [Demequina sp. EGI L300058]